MWLSLPLFAILWTLVLAVTKSSKPFTYNSTSFLLHGAPFQIIGGQMDPQHILYSDRLYKAGATGLNTIFSYFWDQIQPTEDTWEFSGRNNIAEYFCRTQEVGLQIMLRAGPYVCGEHEWGGYPTWLSKFDVIVVRSNNTQCLAKLKAYIDRLGAELQSMMITNGGPVIMVQIENEYGSYGAESTYMAALRDIFTDAFGVTLYTNDGGYEEDVINGHMFEAREEYVTDPTCLGPLLDGEYYTTRLDFWASNYTNEADVGSANANATIKSDLNWTLANGHSISLYMFHGVTNWGLQNGADWIDALEPVITSYDYGAPLDESERTTDVCFAIRDTIAHFIGNESIPNPPMNTNLISIPAIEMKPAVALFYILPTPTKSIAPPNIERLGQSHGFALY